MNLPNYKKCEEFAGVLFIIFSGLVITALYKISNYMTFPNLDELLWQTRSRVFWDKITTFDFSGLIQSAQPGIMVYWFTGFMMKFVDFDFSYMNYLVEKEEAAGGNFNDVMNTNDQAVYAIYERVSFLFNFPLIMLMVVFFILFYYLIRKIGFNRVIASFSLFFLVSNIFFIYWTTPSDKMLNIFMTLSTLTFLVYMRNRASKKYLVYSAIFGSWAVLSKISALFIIPFFFMVYAYYLCPIDRKKIIIVFKDAAVWAIVFCLVSIIFLPTIVTNPVEIYNLIFTTSGNVYETTYGAKSFVFKLPDYLGPMFMILGSSMSPGIIIYLVVFAYLASKKKYRSLFDYGPRKEVNIIGAYIILFMIEVAVLSINHDIRFMSPAFVMLNIIAGVAFYNVMEIIRKKLNFGLIYYYQMAMIVIILSQILTIFSTGLMMQEFIKKIFNRS
ncbi:MAG: hypothetical protein WC788_06360 [Candidatus Paceibacterota bacterium]